MHSPDHGTNFPNCLQGRVAVPNIPPVGVRVTWLDAPARVRLGLAVVGLLMAAALDLGAAVLPWTLLVLGLDIVATLILRGSTTPAARGEAISVLVGASAMAGVAYGLTGVASLLLLPVVAYHCGLMIGRRAIIWTVGVAAVAETVVVATRDGIAELGHNFELSWLLTGVIFVLLGAWSLQLSESHEELDKARAREASALIRRLEEVTGSIGTGLDAPALGDSALRELRALLAVERTSLIANDDGWPVPIALTGATRFPWREPTREDSALHSAWTSGGSDSTEFFDGRRTRQLLCVSLGDSESRPVGLFVADRHGDAFTDGDRAAIQGLADRWGPLLEATLLFARLRRSVALEERNRLAREMHDGVAQELAALAYRADAVALLVGQEDPRARSAAGSLRDEIRAVVKGVRGHISDLRMIERPDRSLGAILGVAVQDLAATTDLRTELSMRETGMRFPADVELQLHHLVERVLADARRAPGATRVTLDVTLESPNALIRVEHDGPTHVTDATFAKIVVPRGMTVAVDRTSGLVVTISTSPASPAPADRSEQKGTVHDLSRARR